MIYLVCNAHIDPAWLWEWEEGTAATLSTFRAAADFCEAYEGFVFNHNEALLYEYIEQLDPPLFSRIRMLVRKGSWKIMGGWYLQPDCNMPSGESILRQIEKGQAWFRDRFGIVFGACERSGSDGSHQADSVCTGTVETAINFDPFGHSRGLVQLLVKTGYTSYLICRPNPGSPGTDLPGDLFKWEGLDGSMITVLRTPYMYNSVLGNVEDKIRQFLDKERDNRDPGLLLWGVGNHGGGPSRRDIEKIAELSREIPLHHGRPEDFFREIAEESPLPIYRKGINPWGVGCYTSQIRVKQKHRELEGLLFSVEKMAVLAAVNGLEPYPAAELSDAQRDLLLMEFHDILPGSGVEAVEEYGLQLAAHGLEILRRIRFRLLCRLLMLELPPPHGTYPIYAYNPHPWPVEGVWEVELQLADQNHGDIWTHIRVEQNELPVPSQIEKEASNIPLDWRKKISFPAKLQPGLNLFIGYAEPCRQPVSGRAYHPDENALVFSTESMEVKISCATGLITAYAVHGCELIGQEGLYLSVLEDSEDPWGMEDTVNGKELGRFRLMSETEAAAFSGFSDGVHLDPVRIVEYGEVRWRVEALFTYGRSNLVLQYAIPRQGEGIEISLRVYWQEIRSKLKMALPGALPERRRRCRTDSMAGWEELEPINRERVGQKWAAVYDEQSALAVINSGTYGLDFDQSVLRLTLLRSPAYSAHPLGERELVRKDRWSPRIDHGVRQFRFRLTGGDVGQLLSTIDRKALEMNEPPYLLSASPLGAGEGTGKREEPVGIRLEGEGILLSSAVMSDNGMVRIRLRECSGSSARGRLRCGSAELQIELKPFEYAAYEWYPDRNRLEKSRTLIGGR